MKEYILENRKESLYGIPFIKEKSIIGIIANPVDYVIDGIKFINSIKIKSVISESDEFKNKLMDIKFQRYFGDINKRKWKESKIKNFHNLFTIIKSMDLLCELSLTKEDVVYIGKVVSVDENSIDIDLFDTQCKLLDKAYMNYNDITTVTILSDYTDTLSEALNLTIKKI